MSSFAKPIWENHCRGCMCIYMCTRCASQQFRMNFRIFNDIVGALLSSANERVRLVCTWNWWFSVTRTRYFSTRVGARDLSSIDFHDAPFKSRYFPCRSYRTSQFYAQCVYQLLYLLVIRFPFVYVRENNILYIFLYILINFLISWCSFTDNKKVTII